MENRKLGDTFSGFRWAIPEYCQFQGKAIYMDTDVIVLDDLALLWEHPIEANAIVAAKGEAQPVYALVSGIVKRPNIFFLELRN